MLVFPPLESCFSTISTLKSQFLIYVMVSIDIFNTNARNNRYYHFDKEKYLLYLVYL